MKNITITYFSNEDVLFIPVSDEKSPIGDEEYQDDVVLFRNTNDEITGIEIQKFSLFKENKIKIGKHHHIDFKDTFTKVRMLMSCRDIMFSDPKQFEQTMKEWGIEIIKGDESRPKNIHINTKLPTEFASC